MYIDIFFFIQIYEPLGNMSELCAPFFPRWPCDDVTADFFIMGPFLSLSLSFFRLPKCNYIYVRFPSRIPRRYISRRVNTLLMLGVLLLPSCSRPSWSACLYLAGPPQKNLKIQLRDRDDSKARAGSAGSNADIEREI